MSDLVKREDVIEALYEAIRTDLKGTFTDSMSLAIAMGNNIPSAEPDTEPERTAKVIEHDASIMDDRGYKYLRSEYLCENCKKKVIGGDEYCSHCGCRLEWK